ncbi:hypothetical protein RP20_CCG025366 [Aedes albopictus]|nr:hypothetical protein RP20_CCG025366 [Aedes albopictus]
MRYLIQLAEVDKNDRIDVDLDAATPNHDDDADDDTGDDRAGYFGIKWVKLFLFHESFNGLHTSGPSLTEGPRSFVALVHS